MKPMRILSIGAGAIGTYIGGSLVLKGHDVVFVERPTIAEEISSRGLRLTLGEQDHHISKPKVLSSIGAALSLEKFDVTLFALKSYDTPNFIRTLSVSPANMPVILCLSNGVDNEPALEKALGSQKVIAGTVTSAVGRRAAGDIVLERLRGIGIATGHPLSERLTAALNDAGMNARLFPRAVEMKWSKMLTNLIANATSAILDLSPAQIFSDPDLYRLEIMQLREALAVMRAQNIGVVDLPGTPVRLLAFAVRYLPLSVSRPFLQKAVGSGRGGKMPSFHIDLHSKSGKSEVDYLNGAVVRAGVKMGIATPINRVLTETLNQMTTDELLLTQFSHKPERLLQLVR